MGEHGDLEPQLEDDDPLFAETVSAARFITRGSGVLARAFRMLAGKPDLKLPAVVAAAPEQASPAELDRDVVIVQDEEDLDWFLDELCVKAVGYTVAIDEAHDWWHDPRIVTLIRTMRHREQDWWLISQRTATAPHAILSQLDRIVCFHMWWQPDLKMMKERFQLHPGELRSLGVGEYVERDVSMSKENST